MGRQLILGCVLLGCSVLAAAAALDAWVRAEGSLVRRLWAAYQLWYRQHTDYLLDRTPASHFALRQGALGLVLLLIGSQLSSAPLIWAGLFFAGPLLLAGLLAQRVHERRRALQGQIDQALLLIANAMQVAPNLESALSLVAEHLQPPMSEEVARVVSSYRLGQTMDDALDAMGRRCNDPFVTAMITALFVGRRTGGNISATLRRIAQATRESIRVELELASKTRGQRSQFFLIATLYPIGLLAMKEALPQVWVILTTSFEGKATLFVSMGIVGVAVIWALRILNPKNL